MAETQKNVAGKVYKDTEIPIFYKIILPILVLALLIGAPQADLLANILMVIVLFGFSYFGWPIWAMVTADGEIIFRSPLRKYRITSKTLAGAKVGVIRDSRVQIILRSRWRLPINYRVRKYSDAPALAQAVLNIVEQSPNAKVSADAVKLLRQVAAKATTAGK
jgi:hypothetical protein